MSFPFCGILIRALRLFIFVQRMKSSPFADHMRNRFELCRLRTSILSVALSFVKYFKIVHRITRHDQWLILQETFVYLSLVKVDLLFSTILRVCFPICNRKKIVSITASFTKFFDLRVPSHFECFYWITTKSLIKSTALLWSLTILQDNLPSNSLIFWPIV